MFSNNAAYISHITHLATGDSFKTIAISYRVGHSALCGIVKEVASAICAILVEDMMHVPTSEEASEFQKRWQFPNCLGATDGKHVVLQAPN